MSKPKSALFHRVTSYDRLVIEAAREAIAHSKALLAKTERASGTWCQEHRAGMSRLSQTR